MKQYLRPRIVEAIVDEALAGVLSRDSAFASLLAGLVGSEVVFDSISVDRQQRHTGATGTADIVVTYWYRGRAALQLLVENKVDAAFTPDQPARYRISQQARERAGEAERVLTVLMCPEAFAAATRHAGAFDSVVTYKSMLAGVEAPERRLLDMAIQKAVMPYEAEDVPEVSRFFADLAPVVAEVAPTLVLKRNPNVDGARPGASRTIYFDVRKTLIVPPGLPPIRFSLQCWDSGVPTASAKIMLGDWAKYIGTVRPLATAALKNTGFYVRPAGSSLGIVADTPRLDTRKPAAEQAQEIREALGATASLAAWWNESGQTLVAWADATVTSV